jgi:hypothetical protein
MLTITERGGPTMYCLVFPEVRSAPGRCRRPGMLLGGTLTALAHHLANLRRDAPHMTAGATLRRADGSYVGNPTRPARLP